MVVGTIKSYNVHKGWGFVEHGGKDVFVQHKELAGRVVAKGDKISFTVTEGEKGSQATDIKITGSDADAKYKGEVKSFVWSKGYGFITSDAFPGKDLFFMKTSVSEQARDCVDKGGWCTFKLGDETEKGPTATDIFLIGAAGNAVTNRFSKGGGKGYGGGQDVGALLALLGAKGGGGKGGKGIVCHTCGKPGHKSPDCFQGAKGGWGGGGGGGFGVVCHTCGKPGHKSPDCFQGAKGGFGKGGWGGSKGGFGGGGGMQNVLQTLFNKQRGGW